MKTLKLIALFVATSILLSGCKQNRQPDYFTKQIDQLIKSEKNIEEIGDLNLSLPNGIDRNQIKKYFQLGNIEFALVLRNSMNIVLSLPKDFSATFAGILVAEKGDKEWSKYLEIKDLNVSDKNNPYYLLTDNKKLLLTIVDQNGAGSGEGIMKVFALSEGNDWSLTGCYYFGAKYSDPSINSDYFAYSAKFSEQTITSNESCSNVSLLPALK